MSVAPLFNSNMTTVKAKLRLSGSVQTDALVMIDTAVQAARARCYRSLGAVRVMALLAIPYDDNPTDEDGALRLQCNQIEMDMVRQQLLRTLPTLFMDASNVKREAWNEEGLTRLAAEKELAAELERLENDINNGLAAVANPTSGADGDVQGGVIESNGPKLRMGDPVFYRYGRGDFGRRQC